MNESYKIRLAQMSLEPGEKPDQNQSIGAIKSGIGLSPREVAVNAQAVQLLISFRSDDYAIKIQNAFAEKYDRRPNILYLSRRKQLKQQIEILGETARETLLVLPILSDPEFKQVRKSLSGYGGGIIVEQIKD